MTHNSLMIINSHRNKKAEGRTGHFQRVRQQKGEEIRKRKPEIGLLALTSSSQHLQAHSFVLHLMLLFILPLLFASASTFAPSGRIWASELPRASALSARSEPDLWIPPSAPVDSEGESEEFRGFKTRLHPYMLPIVVLSAQEHGSSKALHFDPVPMTTFI